MMLTVSCFQVFQLTALVVSAPSELHSVFTVSLNGVPINHEKLNWAVGYVQEIVRHRLFTQKNFFSETGISMIETAVAAADSVQHRSVIDP